MKKTDTAVAVYDSHTEAETAVKADKFLLLVHAEAAAH